METRNNQSISIFLPKILIIFKKNRLQFEGKEEIELSQEPNDITNDSICTFIKSIQNEEFTINEYNIFSLHQLSIKYEVPKLTEITNEYINSHNIDLIFDIIKYKFSLFKKSEKTGENIFDTEEEEEKIATNFFKYIDRKELVELPVSVLYRIINKPQMKTENMSEQEKKKFIEFLFKCLDKHGREGSVLFSEFNINENQEETMKRLIEEYSSVFDFRMINPLFFIESMHSILKEKERIRNELSISTQKNEELSIKLDEEHNINSEMKNEITQLKSNEIILNEQLCESKEELTKSKEELTKLNEELTKSKEELTKSKEEYPSSISLNNDMIHCPNGVFQYLFTKYGCNPTTNGVVEINGNSLDMSFQKKLPKIIDDKWSNNFWCSTGKGNSYVQIAFKNLLVKIEKYRLRVGFPNGEDFFDNWTLTAIQADGSEIELDKVVNSQEIKKTDGKKGHEATFSIQSTKFVRSVKLTMNGSGSLDTAMRLRNIEFYGYIITE